MRSVDDLDDSILDVTMTRYLEFQQQQQQNEVDAEQELEKLNAAHDSSSDSNWTQMYRIKPEYAVHLSRDNLLQFRIENGKGSTMLKAHCATIRERDILAIVIEAVARAKKDRKQKKKRSQDLVELRIDVVDPNGSNAKRARSTTSVEQYNQIRELNLKMAQMNDRAIDLQKVRCVPTSYTLLSIRSLSIFVWKEHTL